MPSSHSRLLKACLFATGCSGIVAEFTLSTLASYILGNTTLQWTLIMSLMLFTMGVGSRISRYLTEHLLDTFITIEFEGGGIDPVEGALMTKKLLLKAIKAAREG